MWSSHGNKLATSSAPATLVNTTEVLVQPGAVHLHHNVLLLVATLLGNLLECYTGIQQWNLNNGHHSSNYNHTLSLPTAWSAPEVSKCMPSTVSSL